MRASIIACALILVLSACSGSNSTELTGPSTLKCDIAVENSLHGAAPASGASGLLTVSTTRDCAWTVKSDTPWLRITGAATGQGSGSVAYTIAANDQPAQRRGELSVNETPISIVQDPAPCRFTVAAANTTIPTGGGKVTVSVETQSGCTWSAQSSAAWLKVGSISSGTGSGNVTFDASANEGDSRTASLTVAGITIAVAQNAAPCTFTVAPLTQSVPAAGATGSIAVTVRAGCTWTAASSASPWLTVTSGAPEKGPGTVVWQAAPNAGDARTGTVSVAGATVAITQAAAPCTFSVVPLSQNAPVEGAAGSATVTVRPGCTWTAVSDVPWLAISSGAAGNGPGAVAFTIASNPGPPRTGTLTIAGFTFTVSQATVPCAYAIAPRQQFLPFTGGTGATTIFTGPTCPWTAVSDVPWIVMLGATSGIGEGRAVFAIAPNVGAARTGTLTISGQVYTVYQDAAR
jgi:all-beta uncharacterized protein/BACON domain-containing protein